LPSASGKLFLALRGARIHICALVAYAAVALAFSWPLPRHLSTHLNGPLDTDAGIYVWNQWVFHREVVERHSLPYFTDAILSFSGPANLSLHNYTVLADLIALPLIAPLGVVASFNVTYLLLSVLTAYAMFLLGRTLASDALLESWMAGVLFAWSPMLVTRGSQHFSLVAAAPLPLFLLLLLRVQERERGTDAALLGACVAFAMFGDVYYAVYCVMLMAAYVLLQVVQLSRPGPGSQHGRLVVRSIDALNLCLASLVAVIALTDGWEFTALGRLVSLRTLYTPMLALTLLLVVRVLTSYRTSFKTLEWRALVTVARLGVTAGIVAGILLSPVLYALGMRIAEGRFDPPRIFWRSSPAGVDLLAFLVPNPNHPFAPAALFKWLEQPMMALEHVASIPLVVLATIAAAIRIGWRPPRMWVALAALFALLSAGPFIHVAGVNTYVPGPWALLRYVPLISMARTPSRLAVMVMLFAAVLFVLGLRAIRAHYGHRVVVGIAVLVLFELLPAPRALYSASVPAIYHTIAADPRPDIRVLELPYGVSSGTFAVGGYSARAQFGQTVHGKAIAGGTLSRISSGRIADMRRQPIVNALLRLSEGDTLRPDDLSELAAHVALFLDRTRLGYVVIDRGRVSPEAVAAVVRLLRLTYIAADGPYELYRPPFRPAVDDTPRQ
jgi:hypothetical protein